jgi:GLPGLI family protein
MNNRLILQIGNKLSRFYSADYFRNPGNSITYRGADASLLTMPGYGLDATEIFKNKETGKETVATRFAGTSNVYTYEENIPEPAWKITNETATILSYNCIKAVATFRGRVYEAWFTTEIPINNGPWKLGGLPGMILKASDSQKHYVFTCTGIEKLKVKEPIVRYEAKYVPSSDRDVNKLMRNLHEHAVETYAGMGLTYIGDKPIPKRPYNPIERE